MLWNDFQVQRSGGKHHGWRPSSPEVHRPYPLHRCPHMSRSKLIQARLSEFTPGQYGDFFALLTDKNKRRDGEGKAYYTCRFRDGRRTVAFMVWADCPWFAKCED